jgi:hypothetical protein
MAGQKRYQITFRRTEELTVEVEAESEFEARREAVDLVSGRSDGSVAPEVSVPETVDHTVTEWNIYAVFATAAS